MPKLFSLLFSVQIEKQINDYIFVIKNKNKTRK